MRYQSHCAFQACRSTGPCTRLCCASTQLLVRAKRGRRLSCSASGVHVSVTLIQGHWLCLASWHGWLQCNAVWCCRLDIEWVMCSGQWSPFAQAWLALSPSLWCMSPFVGVICGEPVLGDCVQSAAGPCRCVMGLTIRGRLLKCIPGPQLRAVAD